MEEDGPYPPPPPPPPLQQTMGFAGPIKDPGEAVRVGQLPALRRPTPQPTMASASALPMVRAKIRAVLKNEKGQQKIQCKRGRVS